MIFPLHVSLLYTQYCLSLHAFSLVTLIVRLSSSHVFFLGLVLGIISMSSSFEMKSLYWLYIIQVRYLFFLSKISKVLRALFVGMS